MAQLIETFLLEYLLMNMVALWIIHKYPRVVIYQLGIMLLGMPMAFEVINIAVDEGGILWIPITLFVFTELFALTHIVQNFQEGNSLIAKPK